jgi:predicted ABC-type ATPase
VTRNAHTISPSRELEENTVSQQAAPPGLEYKTLLLAEVPLRLQVKSITLDEPAGPGTNGAVNAPYEYVDENGNRIGVAESFVAVTGVRDKVGDIIPPGAFERTLRELEPKACLGHDWTRPIGYPEKIEEWLPGDPRLPETKVDGTPWPEHAGVLWARTRYNLGTEDGRRAYADAKFFGPQRTAWSIGYVPSQTKTRHAVDPHTGLPTRFLHDPDLYEYSQVLHGAHPMALSQAIKSGKPDGIEAKARYVQDSAYWGYPVGTPIRPGMRPRGATARRIRQQGRTPSPNQGVTTEAPKPDEKPKGTRAKPDKITAAADAEALIPEPESEARVRAENPKGKDAEYVAQLAMNEDGTLDGEPEDNRDKAFRGLLAEGITPNELREDLAAVEENEYNTSQSVLEPEDIDDLVEEYTARYNALAKRQARQRRGEPAEGEEASPGEQTGGPAGQEDTGEDAGEDAEAGEQGGADEGGEVTEPSEEGGVAEHAVSLDRLAQMRKPEAQAAVADLDDDTLAAYDSELAARASELGKPGQRSIAHQAVLDEIAKREQAGGGEAPAAGEQEAGTPEQRVVAALDELVKPGDWARIADLRAALPDMDDAELTETLKRMGKTGSLTLAPDPSGKRITDRDRQAAVMIGGDENHLVVREPDAETESDTGEAGAGDVAPEEEGVTEDVPASGDALAEVAAEEEGGAGAPGIPGPGQVPARAPLNAEGDHYDEQGNLISGGGAFEAAQNQALDAINDGDEIALADALEQLRKGHFIELSMADGTRVRSSESTASLAAELISMDRPKARTRIREWAEGGIDRHQRQTESDFIAQVDAYRTLDDDELSGEAERLEAERVQLSDQGLDTYDSAMWENGVQLRALDAVRAERAGGTPIDTGAPSPERTAMIAADEVADAEEIADAAHGLTEADDGEFEVDDDVAARQDRVAGMLAQAESGGIDFTTREPEQLRADRADVVAELRMQAHMESRRRRRERGQPPAETEGGSTASGAEAVEETPAVEEEPKPPVRPGVAGAAEDLADALESGDTEAINRTRARLASSLRRSRSDAEPVKALRALMDGNEDPTPQQLRAAAEAIRADTRARRNQAARSRRTARRFERERLRSLLGQIESAMVAKGMELDRVPEDDPDYNPDGLGTDNAGALPGESANTAGTWLQKIETIQWSGERRTLSEVEGTHYRASVYAPEGRPASYEWEITDSDGQIVAKADGVAPDLAGAQAAVEIALETQARLGNLPADAQLPTASAPGDSSARPLSEVDAAMDKVRERLASPSRTVNPITGEPDPLNPEAVPTRPPTTRTFETPEQVRRHLEARAATLEGNSRISLNNLINTVRWDDVQLTPGGRFMVAQRSGEKGYELYTTTHGIRLPVGSYTNSVSGKNDILRAGALYESVRADSGAVIDWTVPNEQVVETIRGMKFGRHGDGVQGMNNAVIAALTYEKLRAGKWSDKLVRDLSKSTGVRSNITNWTREDQANRLRRTLTAQIGGGFGNRVHPEDKKTLAVADGAEVLANMGAPDAAAVLLRRRAAELREGFGAADADNAHGAALLDNLAVSYLGMYSPVRSPGERALTMRAGERLVLSAEADDSIGGPDPNLPELRSFRALTAMRKEGAYGSSTALVVDEGTGEQYELRIGSLSAGGGQRLAIYKRGANYPERNADLGSSTFVVVGPEEPVPASREELTGLATSDAAVFGQNVLDAAANALPETPAERAARQGAAPAGGRAPRRTSSRAPRRTAPRAQVTPTAVAGQQHLAAAQGAQRQALLGMDFALTDESAPNGFASLEDAIAWAATRAASFPEAEKNVKGTEAYMLNFMVEGPQFTKAGGARLSPGGHFIVTKDHYVIHIRTGGAVWGMADQREGYTDASADSAMAVADYLERGRWSGQGFDWSRGREHIQSTAKKIMESNTLPTRSGERIGPSTIAARAAITDMLGSIKTPKVADLGALKHFASTFGGVDIMPNPDRYDLMGSRSKASRYAALAGVRTQGADMLPANSKAGEKLAKRVRTEMDIAEPLAALAPLDAVRRLNRVADEIGDETVTDTDGKTFKPADDLRALAKRITDGWDRDKPSPLGRLLANDSQGVLTVNDSVTVESSPVYYGTSQDTSETAQKVADGLTEQLNAAGRQVTLRRNPDDPEGKLVASFGNVTITPRSGSDDRIDINSDGSISLYWRAPHIGRMSLRLPPGSWDTGGKLDDAAYAEHTRRVENILKQQMEEGNTTDVRFTVGGDGQSWTVERAEAHQRVMEAIWKATETVPRDHRAVIAGGLGGAGKSTVLRGFANIADGDYFTINPDDVKEEMARQGLIPDVPGLSPMEASPLVHEESSHIANMLARRAYREGINVMWDITMSKRSSVEKRITELRENGYDEIDAVFVDIPVETSVERALARHRRGMESYRTGKGFGGRYVPPALIRANASAAASSANRETFDQLQEQFDSWVVYDNSVAGRDPERVDGVGRWAG